MSAGSKRRVHSPSSSTPSEDANQRDKRARLSASSSSSTMSSTQALFTTFRTELDAHHDFNEKLVRFSRDVTADSKKLIFLLHRFNPLFPPDHPANQKLLKEAQGKANVLRMTILITASCNRLGPSPDHPTNVEEMKQLAEEVAAAAASTGEDDGQMKKEAKEKHGHKPSHQAYGTEDSHTTKLVLPPMSKAGIYADRYERTFGPGLEEYIEAVSFLRYLETRQLISFRLVQLLFQPALSDPETDLFLSEPLFRVPVRRYLLGISDLSGELMRFATNAVGAGDITGEIVVADVLRTLRHIKGSLDTFVPLVGRELAKKQSVTEQSVRKIEDLLYALRVRTSEFGDNPEALKLMAERALSFSTSGAGSNDADDAYASFND